MLQLLKDDDTFTVQYMFFSICCWICPVPFISDHFTAVQQSTWILFFFLFFFNVKTCFSFHAC